MKRTIGLLALILTLTLALSAAAMATEIDYEKGETNATKSVSAVSLVDGCELKFDGDKLNVTYTNSALKEGDMVIVFLLLPLQVKMARMENLLFWQLTPTATGQYLMTGERHIPAFVMTRGILSRRRLRPVIQSSVLWIMFQEITLRLSTLTTASISPALLWLISPV